MTEIIQRTCLTATIAAFACLGLSASAAAAAQGERRPDLSSTVESSLKAFLQAYDSGSPSHDDTRYFAAFVDLHGDGAPEAIVYLTGRWWCGSGGCPTLVLARSGSSFRIVTSITVTRTPIRVLRSTSHGWHDLVVWVRGGGIRLGGYQAELRFDGKTYPSNPSVPPAVPLSGKVGGRIVISGSEEGVPLYP